jgi:hypothetical protein
MHPVRLLGEKIYTSLDIRLIIELVHLYYRIAKLDVFMCLSKHHSVKSNALRNKFHK